MEKRNIYFLVCVIITTFLVSAPPAVVFLCVVLVGAMIYLLASELRRCQRINIDFAHKLNVGEIHCICCKRRRERNQERRQRKRGEFN